LGGVILGGGGEKGGERVRATGARVTHRTRTGKEKSHGNADWGTLIEMSETGGTWYEAQRGGGGRRREQKGPQKESDLPLGATSSFLSGKGNHWGG